MMKSFRIDKGSMYNEMIFLQSINFMAEKLKMDKACF